MKPVCRVLKVYGNLGTGGAETWLISLLRYVAENQRTLPCRLEFHVFLTNGYKSDFDDEAIALGAILHYSQYSRSNVFGFYREWRRVLDSHDFHVIHDHQENTAGIHFLMGLGILPDLRIVHLHNPKLHLNNYEKSLSRKFLVRFGKLLIAHLGTHVLSTSAQLLGELGYNHAIFKKLARHALYCGFDTSKLNGNRPRMASEVRKELDWPTESKIMLFVGRLNSSIDEVVNQKNPEFALEVARKCVERDPMFHFLMVGGGEPTLTKLRNQVISWGMNDRIRLVGQSDKVAEYMLGADLLILTSIAEGLGMVIVEAQAAGLQSLVSSVTPGECVVESKMVQFQNLSSGIEEWSDCVFAMIENPNFPHQQANKAVYDSKFSIENSILSLLEIYSSNMKLRL